MSSSSLGKFLFFNALFIVLPGTHSLTNWGSLIEWLPCETLQSFALQVSQHQCVNFNGVFLHAARIKIKLICLQNARHVNFSRTVTWNDIQKPINSNLTCTKSSVTTDCAKAMKIKMHNCLIYVVAPISLFWKGQHKSTSYTFPRQTPCTHRLSSQCTTWELEKNINMVLFTNKISYKKEKSVQFEIDMEQHTI